jgi:hypothetical protein
VHVFNATELYIKNGQNVKYAGHKIVHKKSKPLHPKNKPTNSLPQFKLNAY